MQKSKKLSRNVFLVIGVLVGILIFLLGSQLNANLGRAHNEEFKNEQLNEPNPIVKKFFS
jgi:hypothetical protein